MLFVQTPYKLIFQFEDRTPPRELRGLTEEEIAIVGRALLKNGAYVQMRADVPEQVAS